MAIGNLIPGRNRNAVAERTNRDPFFALHDQINRVFDDFTRGFGLPALASERGVGWPNVDVTEDDKRYSVEVELPGLEEKDVEVTLTNNVLTIRGEKRAERDDAKRHYSERYFGQFERRIALDAEVEPDKVNAKFKNGVLKIEIQKTDDAQRRSRRIPISS
jgi:HSP20 family protein